MCLYHDSSKQRPVKAQKTGSLFIKQRCVLHQLSHNYCWLVHEFSGPNRFLMVSLGSVQRNRSNVDCFGLGRPVPKPGGLARQEQHQPPTKNMAVKIPKVCTISGHPERKTPRGGALRCRVRSLSACQRSNTIIYNPLYHYQRPYTVASGTPCSSCLQCQPTGMLEHAEVNTKGYGSLHHMHVASEYKKGTVHMT